jgi:hypothetical protein
MRVVYRAECQRSCAGPSLQDREIITMWGFASDDSETQCA